MKFLILLIFYSLQSYAQGMADNSGFNALYLSRLKLANETNDFEFRLVDQYGTPTSLSDHYDNEEIVLISFHPDCQAKVLFDKVLNLNKENNNNAKGLKKLTTNKFIFIVSDLNISRDSIIDKFPHNLILFDECRIPHTLTGSIPRIWTT